MKIVVIGVGMIGTRHADYFGDAGHQIITVDRKPGADCAHVASVPDPSSVDAWVVATPTAAHLRIVGEVLHHQPDARILLEKPACYPGEITDLARIVRRHPTAKIVVNDVYAYSEAVQRFAHSVRRFTDLDPLKKITIEFTKNRERDIANGRFVDTQYGEAGYEFFHMLSILRSVLPLDLYRTYLRTAPHSITPEMRVRTSTTGLPEVELYASSTGIIGFADLAGFAFSDTTAQRCIQRSMIPFGTELRYRFADAELASGRHITLVFEPNYGMAIDYKNIHAVHIRDATSQEHVMVSGNHFKKALLLQLDLLRRNPDNALLRLAEHRYMAALSLAESA